MAHRLFAVAAAIILLLPAEGSAANRAEDKEGPGLEESKRICRHFSDALPPAKDRPEVKFLTALKGCDAEALYYGIGRPADPVAARLCAFADKGGPFAGAELLMTIYANGIGAERDFDVAINLACNIGGTPAEIDRRVKHLYKLRQQDWTGRDFSWCDDVSSSLAQAQCAHHEERVARAQREIRLAKLAEKWAVEPVAGAFSKLRKSADAFIESRSGEEVDQSGPERASLVIGEAEALHRQFLDDLQGFAEGRPPCAETEQVADADDRLNAAYQKIQRTPAERFRQNRGTIGQAGIKRTELAWLKYRDAWVAFAAAAYPAIPKQNVATWLTLRRLAQLEELVME